MVAIFTGDATYIKSDIDEAFDTFVEVYGSKLADEAYNKLKNAPLGFSYRKNGGPLIKIISKEDANIIKDKERSLGRLLE